MTRLRPAFLLVLLTFIAPLPFDDAEAAKIKFAYIASNPASSAVYWLPVEAGLYKKYGLDVELVFLDGSTRGAQALVAGDVHFSHVVGTSAINAKLAGGDIVIVSSQTNTLPYYVIARPEIKSMADLKGKTSAAHIPGTAADFAMRLALKKVGLSYSDIKAVTVGGSQNRMAIVKAGQVDFTVAIPGEKAEADRLGLTTLMDIAKLNIPFQFACVATTSKMIRENPETVQSIVKGLAEAVHYFKTRKDDVIKVMEKYSRGMDRRTLEEFYDAYTGLYVEDTYPTLEGLRNTLEIMSTTDPRASKVKAEELVDLRFVDELKRSGFVTKLYGR